MKILTALAAAVLLAAGCNAKTPVPEAAAGPASESQTQAALCIPSQTREVAITVAGAKDVLEAQVIGATCEQAVVLLTLRKADGFLLWSHSARATDTLAFVPASDDAPVNPPKAMETFLAEVLKNVRVERTGEAPDWPEGAERPEDPSGLYHATLFPRDAYVILRKKNAPMLCVQAEMGTSYCAAYDPEFDDVANTLYSSSS